MSSENKEPFIDPKFEDTARASDWLVVNRDWEYLKSYKGGLVFTKRIEQALIAPYITWAQNLPDIQQHFKTVILTQYSLLHIAMMLQNGEINHQK